MTEAAPPGWRLQVHESLPSTQDAALDAARTDDPGRLAILAARQTAGRGRAGRSWVAPAGNLNLSVLCRPGAGPIEPGRWALLAALALHAALAPYAPALQLKWPNDVLLRSAKLAGILIDCVPGQAVVIGFGANLAAAPAIDDRPTAHLPPPAPDPSSVAACVLRGLDVWSAQPMPALVEAWLARAHPVGTLLDVRMPQRRVQGAFAGLTPAGELLLAGQPAAISSAEIFLA